MGAVATRFAAESRLRWRSWLALALLAGVAGGAVVAGLAGAERAGSAYERFLDASNPFHVAVQGSNELDFAAISSLPEVAESADVAFVLLDVSTGDDERGVSDEVTPLVSTSPAMWTTFNRAKVLAGRRPDPAAPDEIAITPTVARRGLDVGDVLEVRAYHVDQSADVLGPAPPSPAGPRLQLRVVGIEVAPSEFLTSGNGTAIHLTPAFLDAHPEAAVVGGIAVGLHRGDADVDAFKQGVERLTGGAVPNYITQRTDAAEVERSIRLQAVALRLFAAAVAAAGLLIVGQALARQATLDNAEHPTLAALGMAPSELRRLALLRVGSIGFVAALVSAAVAVAVSPFVLFGLAEQAEPDPGVSVGPVLLPLGMAGVWLVTVAAAAPSILRRTGPVAGRRRGARTADYVSRSSLGPVATTGISMALAPGRGAPGAVRTAVAGSVFSVAAVALTITFGASLDHLLETPRLYGWGWDAVFGNPYAGDDSDVAVPALRSAPGVASLSSVAFGEVEIDGERTQALAFERVTGDASPPIVEGRAPSSDDEIVLGASVLDAIGRDLDDVVDVGAGDAEATMRVVGTAVFPRLGQYDVRGLGEGALLTIDGLRRVAPELPENLYAVTFEDGLDAAEAAAAVSEATGYGFGADQGEPPKDVADFAQFDALPAVLAGLLASVGVGALAHGTLSSARRRRRELATLKALGFAGHDIRGVVVWQAATIAVIALAVGLPLGVGTGRASWDRLATSLGVVTEHATGPLALAGLALGTLAVSCALALIPGRIAARTPAHVALHGD